jgi:HlyD family secretion protein
MAVKKLLLILIGTGLLLTAGVYAWHAWYKHETEHLAYTLAPVERGTLEDVVSAAGLVRPREVYIVGSDLSGKVVAVLADFNQSVEEGDVLLRLDDRLARSRLQQAEAAVQLARVAVRKAEIERDTARKMYQRLHDMSKEVRKQEDVDIAEGKLHAAEALVEEARLKVRQAEDAQRQADVGLRLTKVRVPILGATGSSASPENRPGTGVVSEDAEPNHAKRSFIVLERKVSVNQEIGSSVQGHLFTLASDLQRMRVTAEIGEGDIDKVRRGMTVRFSVGGSDTGPKYTGTIEDIHLTPSHEHGAVFYQVLIDARNERAGDGGDWKLRPGQTASVDIIRRAHKNAWKVPSAALNFEPDTKQQSEDARKKLAQHAHLPHAEEWQTVWTVRGDGKPWPIFVRTGGKNEQGDTGIQEDRFTEALEWDEEVKDPATLKVITSAPPPKKSIFTIPNIKF